jgi:hypothetical protein
MKTKRIPQRVCVAIMSFALLGTGAPAVSHAGIIETSAVVEAGQRDADLATLSAALHRAEVRAQLASMGVDAAALDARLASLTDSELRQMAEQMEQAPAGGDLLAVVGAVFVVLLILELVGVIDIFKNIGPAGR